MWDRGNGEDTVTFVATQGLPIYASASVRSFSLSMRRFHVEI